MSFRPALRIMFIVRKGASPWALFFYALRICIQGWVQRGETHLTGSKRQLAPAE